LLIQDAYNNNIYNIYIIYATQYICNCLEAVYY
jgi:hypothetical protein